MDIKWQEIADNAPLCASESCHRMGVVARWWFESGDVGSSYCTECKEQIEAQEEYAHREAEEYYQREMQATHR